MNKSSYALVLLAGAIFSIGYAALARGAEPIRYPWDSRPESCFAAPDSSSAKCTSNDWPTYDETAAKLRMLYKTEQFGLLERALNELAESSRTFETGWPLSTAINRTFGDLTPSSSTTFLPDEPLRIERWRLAVPQSKYLPIFESRYLYAKAWNIRGTGFANSVSEQSWTLYRKYLAEAERKLLAMPKAQQQTVTWHHSLLLVSRDMDEPAQTPSQIFEAAIEKWPDHYPLYNSMAYHLQPKWGGSWPIVERFVDKWTTRNLERDGGALYARIYINLRDQDGYQEMRPDWSKLKRGFDSLIKQYPTINGRNNYASFACAARDKATFIAVMRDLAKDQIRPPAWLKGHSHAACVEWAYEKA